MEKKKNNKKNKIVRRSISIITALAMTAVMTASFKTTNTSADIYYSDDYDEFLYALGNAESGNNYACHVAGSEYLGRWMTGTACLQTVGFLDGNGNWTPLANSYGVYSTDDYLNTPSAQDYVILQAHRNNWNALVSNGAASHLGETFNGTVVTVAGLIGASHLVGPYGVVKMFRGQNPVDGNGVSAYSYMTRFGGYDIGETIYGQTDTTVGSTPDSAYGNYVSSGNNNNNNNNETESTQQNLSRVDTDGTIYDTDGSVLAYYDPKTQYVETTYDSDGIPHYVIYDKSQTTASANTKPKTTTTTSVATPTPKAVEQQNGDVNNDGKIDNTDANLILQDYSEKMMDGMSEIDVKYGDVNGDGEVNSEDATDIIIYLSDTENGAGKLSLKDYIDKKGLRRQPKPNYKADYNAVLDTLKEERNNVKEKDKALYYSKYYIADVDRDGILEIIIKTGTNINSPQYRIYRANNEGAKFIGKVDTVNTAVYSYDGNYYLEDVKSPENISRLDIKDNKLNTTVLDSSSEEFKKYNQNKKQIAAHEFSDREILDDLK